MDQSIGGATIPPSLQPDRCHICSFVYVHSGAPADFWKTGNLTLRSNVEIDFQNGEDGHYMGTEAEEALCVRRVATADPHPTGGAALFPSVRLCLPRPPMSAKIREGLPLVFMDVSLSV